MEQYVFQAHAFTGHICSWRYCRKCGLVFLRNGFTAWCVSKGCNYEDHPSYTHQRNKK